MELSNRSRVGQAFDLLADGLAAPVDNAMCSAFNGKQNWNELWSAEDAKFTSKKPMTYSKTDVQILLKAIAFNGHAFRKVLPRHHQALASELLETRNNWAHNEPFSPADTSRALDTIQRLLEAVGATRQANEVRKLRRDAQRVLVGTLPGSVAYYQPRSFDTVIEQNWAAGSDRRLWLSGSPGMGKSYAARRILHEALAQEGVEREDLLVWVDSADASTVINALSDAADRMRQSGFIVNSQTKESPEQKVKALLGVLATSEWRWLIIFDNADAAAILEAGLIPTGSNTNGRALITTLSNDHRMSSNGRVVAAELFSAEEAIEYLRRQIDPRTGDLAAITHASDADATALAKVVGYHPLALSIASATIVVNAMDISGWISEFESSELVDAAADERDRGGYPLLIGATWQLALEKASQGLPDGVIERAAMVAAIQSPDGHPTWLWDRETVTRWVSGGVSLAQHHGKPAAVQRLIDHHILEIDGHSWKNGRVKIHQLAARAVREVASQEKLSALASILVHEWMLQLTDNESPAIVEDIQRNLRFIATMPNLQKPTRDAVTVLLQPDYIPDPNFENHLKQFVDFLSEYLRQGGPDGRAHLATELIGVGLGEESLGRIADAHQKYEEALAIYEELVNSHAGEELERAAHLRSLGELEAKLGRSNRARERLTEAVSAYERILDKAQFRTEAMSSLEALVELHELLGNPEEKRSILASADEAFKQTVAEKAKPLGGEVGLREPERLEKLGYQWQALNRLDDAKECLARAAELYEQLGADLFYFRSRHALADIHIELSEWESAAILLRTSDSQEYQAKCASVLWRLQLDEEALEYTARMAKTKSEQVSADDRSRTEPQTPNDNSVELNTRGDSPEIEPESLFQLRLKYLHSLAFERRQWDFAKSLATASIDLAYQHGLTITEEDERDLGTLYQSLVFSHLELGLMEKAEESAAHALNIYQALFDLNPDDHKATKEIALSFNLLGRVRQKSGQHAEASEAFTKVVAICENLVNKRPSDQLLQSELWQALYGLGGTYSELQLFDRAIDSYIRAIDVLRTMAAQSADDLDLLDTLADTYIKLANTYQISGRMEEAIEPTANAISLRQTILASDPENWECQENLATALSVAGHLHDRCDRLIEAANFLTNSIDMYQIRTEREPDDLQAQGRMAAGLLLLGEGQKKRDLLAEAANSLERSVKIFQVIAELSPGQYEAILILALKSWGGALGDLGRIDDARAAFDRADDLVQQFPESFPPEFYNPES